MPARALFLLSERKAMKRSRILLVFGITLTLMSAAILVVGYRVTRSGVTAAPAIIATQSAQVPADAVSGEPVTLTIPSLHYNLPIIDGAYNAKTGEWTLTKDKVQFATISTLPNDKAGNTFLYGHYRKEVFSSLHTIKDGAEATVKTSNGHTFRYKLSYRKTVNPEESAGIFTADGAPTLTIQTCTGLFFQDRQLFVFSFEGVA